MGYGLIDSFRNEGWGKDLMFVSKWKGEQREGRFWKAGHPDGHPVLVLKDLGSWPQLL